MCELKKLRMIPLPVDQESYMSQLSLIGDLIKANNQNDRNYLCRLVIGCSAYYYQMGYKAGDEVAMGNRAMVFTDLESEVQMQQKLKINNYIVENEELLVEVDLIYTGRFIYPLFFVITAPFFGDMSSKTKNDRALAIIQNRMTAFSGNMHGVNMGATLKDSEIAKDIGDYLGVCPDYFRRYADWSNNTKQDGQMRVIDIAARDLTRFIRYSRDTSSAPLVKYSSFIRVALELSADEAAISEIPNLDAYIRSRMKVEPSWLILVQDTTGLSTT